MPLLRGVLVLSHVVAACVALFLTALGLALTLDLLSFRALLASLEARPVLRVAIRAHAALQHSGAQILETFAGITGLILLGWLTWHILRPGAARPSPRVRSGDDRPRGSACNHGGPTRDVAGEDEDDGP